MEPGANCLVWLIKWYASTPITRLNFSTLVQETEPGSVQALVYHLPCTRYSPVFTALGISTQKWSQSWQVAEASFVVCSYDITSNQTLGVRRSSPWSGSRCCQRVSLGRPTRCSLVLYFKHPKQSQSRGNPGPSLIVSFE